MPEEGGEKYDDDTTVNPEIEKIKADFKKEFDEWKESMSKEMEAKDAKIKELTEANDGLRASIVRAATTQAKETPKEKTPEELYREEVAMYADKTINIMKKELIG